MSKNLWTGMLAGVASAAIFMDKDRLSVFPIQPGALMGIAAGTLMFSPIDLRSRLFIYGLWYRLIYVLLFGVLGWLGFWLSEMMTGTFYRGVIAMATVIVAVRVWAEVVNHHANAADKRILLTLARSVVTGLSLKMKAWIVYLSFCPLCFVILLHKCGIAVLSEGYTAGVTAFLFATVMASQVGTDYALPAIRRVNFKLEKWLKSLLEPIDVLEGEIAQKRSAIATFMLTFMTMVLLYAGLYYGLDQINHGGDFNFVSQQSGNGKQTISPLDAVYFSTITAATIGYGDVTPQGPAAKVLVIAQVFTSFWFAGFGINLLLANSKRGEKPKAEGPREDLLPSQADLLRPK